MKRFQWRILLCVLPVLAALAYLTPKFLQGKEGFKLGVDLRGGTILVYEEDMSKSLSDNVNPAELAASIKRRIDPTDLKNITVRPVGNARPYRVEIILPFTENKGEGGPDEGRAVTQDDVAYIKSLIAEVGSLEFRFLANSTDDLEAITKAEEFFKAAAADKTKADLLDRLAREGKPPPPPEPPTDRPLVTADGRKFNVFNAENNKGMLTYSWVELDRQERKTLGLDNAAETQAEPGGLWMQARDAREKGVTFRAPGLGGALLYSRKAQEIKMPAAEKERKKYEYFVLTRDPERDPLTGEPKRISGEYLTSAYPGEDKGRPAVHFRFNARGGDLFHDLTSRNIPTNDFYRFLAIILDGKIVSAPSLRQAIRTDGQISGNFTMPEVQRLVSILRSGALPATLKPTPVSENTMGSTLGADTIRRGTWSIGLAFLAVLAFMVVYYRFAGFVASVALLANLLLTIAFMVAVNATFTLPGLAGLVLTLGMAVDANVLIYERLREERDRGATLSLALRNGYDRSFATIIDTHLSSIFTAIVLWAIGNDQLKGFGISLAIGLVISLFTSLYMTRVIFDVWLHNGWLRELRMFRLFAKPNIDFMSVRYYWFTATVLLTIFGLAVFLFRGERGLNIDFTGGTAYGGELSRPLDITELRKQLNDEQIDPKTGQRVLAAEVRPVEPDAEGRSRRWEVIYAGDKPRTIELIEPAGAEEVRQRVTQLPDLAVEQIFVGTGEGGGRSRFFTVRTSEKDFEVVRVAVNRLLGDDLKRIELTSFQIDDAGKGATLTFNEPASTAQVSLLFKQQLEALGLKQEAQQFEVLGKGESADGGFTSMRVEFTDAPDRGRLEKALTQTQQEFRERPQPQRLEKFDSQLARDTQLRALYAILASWAAVLLYVWFRFGNWTFGLAAVLCLFHDVCFTLGIVAFCHYIYTGLPWLASSLMIQDFKIDLPAVAALLTLVGYSINDKIVVYDRMREVRGKNPILTAEMINDSINQALSRTVLTGLSVMLVLLVLYIAGGEGVHLFAFVMLIGMVVGTYSSIYIASPLLLIFGEGMKPTNVRGQRAPAPEGAAV